MSPIRPVPDPRGTPPTTWPSRATERRAVERLAREITARRDGGLYERDDARRAARRALSPVFRETPPDLRVEAVRDLTAQASWLADYRDRQRRAAAGTRVPRRPARWGATSMELIYP